MPSTNAESLHRLIKLDLDTGNANSLDEASTRFHGYRLGVIVEQAAATDPAQQAALLTIVNTARRTFLGGVTVCGALHERLLVPLPLGETLAVAVQKLGGHCVETISNDVPVIHVGRATTNHPSDFAISTTYQGWRGGIVPAASSHRLAEQWSIAPAGVLSGALAVHEAFRFVRRERSIAGRRKIDFSLWSSSADGRPLTVLPSELWIGGLGHLGQAFLWSMGMLPYADTAENVKLTIQDFDRVSKSSISTSVLAETQHVQQRKTRVVADWLEQRGFQTTVCERRFDEHVRVSKNDPRILIACFDNANARRAVEVPGFEAIVEAGLGSTAASFQSMRMHTFPGPSHAATLWPRDRTDIRPPEDQPAYQKLRQQGMDSCGVTLLAQKAVGAPFVGCVAATFMLAEAIKLVMGGPIRSVFDLNLHAPREFETYSNNAMQIRNPGYVEILDSMKSTRVGSYLEAQGNSANKSPVLRQDLRKE